MDASAILYPLNTSEVNIHVNVKEFVLGRAKDASHVIKDLEISRTHCVLRYAGQWTLSDQSSGGTWVNKKRLKGPKEATLQDGDHISLSSKYNYIFCNGGQDCIKSCHMKVVASKSVLDAELAQRRRLFEHRASLQKDGFEKCLQEKLNDRYKLEQQQELLLHKFNQQLQTLEDRNRKLFDDLDKKGNSSDLLQEKERLESQLKAEKQSLEEKHMKETSELASKISAFEAAESELRSQNKALLEQLEHEKQQFELRLEEERKVLEAKFNEQLAEKQKLEMQREREREEQERELRAQEEQREREREERERELRAQEEQREQERKEREEKMEADFLARKKELEDREKVRELEYKEVTKELLEREAELQRKAEEHEKELEVQRLKEQEQLKKEQEQWKKEQEELKKEQERLKKELEQREQEMKQKLEFEILKLQEEKVSLEMSIRGELSKKEGENAESLQKLTSELEQVKRDLNTTSTKRSLLEKELEEASRAKEAASQSHLQAKKDVIENFGELVESELQCSICNELFVTATTLNCNHTFCYVCISEWLSKQKKTPTCPICRAPCRQQSRSLVLDNFIDRMVENLSDDLKRRRKDIVDERKGITVTLDPNPSKKRKVNSTTAPAPAPLQTVNSNVIAGRVIPVTSIPPGTPVIHLPISSINRGVQLFTVPSTSHQTLPSTSHQTVPQPQQAAHISQQPRLQPLRPQLPHLVPQSLSAPNQMMTQIVPVHQVRQQGIRYRGGAAPRGYGRPTAATVRVSTPVILRPSTPTVPRYTVPPAQPTPTAPRYVNSTQVRATYRHTRP